MKDENREMNADHLPAAGLSIAELKELIRQELQAFHAAIEANNDPGDFLLSTKEAARRLGYSTDWLYRNKTKFPFFKRVGHKLGFSSRGLEEYLRTRKFHGSR